MTTTPRKRRQKTAAEPGQAPDATGRKFGLYDTPSEEKKAFGARLREARELAGMTQIEAAATLGYSQSVQLSLMEAGIRPVPLAVVIACAKLYGTTTDYLCGLVSDSDRDPAVAVQRHIASRVTAEVQRLIRHMAVLSTDAVREVMPGAADGQRMAALVRELNLAMAVFRQHNPKFDNMRGGATLARKVELATEAAVRYMAQADRARRLMEARTMRESDRTAAGQDSQMSMLPVLDLSLNEA